MRFASALSLRADPLGAAEEAVAAVREGLGGARPDVAFLFPHLALCRDAEALGEAVRRGLGTDVLLGASGAGVLAAGREAEDVPALALLAGTLPSGCAEPFRADAADLETGIDWASRAGPGAGGAPSFVLVADPFSMDVLTLLDGMDRAFPGRPKVGGMASGGRSQGAHVLFCGPDVLREGAAGLALTGAVGISPLVSQGCRPVGPRFVITRGERNVVRELAGKPALGVIREVLEGLAPADRELAANGLLIGRVVEEARTEFHRGDFLIRGLVGADETTGAVAVGDLIRRGQTVQLQVRDGATADEDLRALLDRRRDAFAKAAPAAALVFSCNGRGAGMYGDADHDSRLLREALPGLPLAGFFCNGEIGPVGERTFLHGFTSSVGFLSPR